MEHFVVSPVIKSVINWKDYTTLCKMFLGFSITKELDERQLNIKDNAAFVRTLNLINESRVLDHSYYGFLVIASSNLYFDLMQYNNKINITLRETNSNDLYLGILSGSLTQYRDLILSITTGEEDYVLRRFGNTLYDHFINEDLYKMFDLYTRRSMDDGSYRLLELK